MVCALLHELDRDGWRSLSPSARAQLLLTAVDQVLADPDDTKRFLDEAAAFARWYRLVRPHEPAITMGDDAELFAAIAGAVRKLSERGEAQDPRAEQAIRQFLSEGLAAGEVVDVFALMGDDRPELSVLSDEFLDALTARTDNPHLGIAALRRLLDGEIRTQGRRNQAQARLFSERMQEVLARYNLRQVSTAEIIRDLVAMAKDLRAARRRHEALGLEPEEVAFYDAIAGVSDSGADSVDQQVADIAKELAAEIKKDLTVDWTTRASAEAAIRVRIKRLLRKHRFTATTPGGGGAGGGLSTDEIVTRILSQAKALYAAWPEV